MIPQVGQTYMGPGDKPATVLKIANGWVTCQYNAGWLTIHESNTDKRLRPQSKPTST